MSDGTRIQKDLLEAIRAATAQKTKAYDVTAKVTRVEDGKMYVHIPGGIDETPVEMTVSAQPGDLIKVRVANGRAWVTGNATAPPTDDKRANQAYSAAKAAQGTAEDAAEAAKTAWEYADDAKEAAESAEESAYTANNAANNALVQLSVVEDVAGTLAWIQEHGSYVETTDTSVQQGTIYFELISGQYVPIANPDPEANPQSEGWYVLDVSDSQAQYIMAHLAVTSAGLWVLPAGSFASHPIEDSSGNTLVDSNSNPLVSWQTDPQNADGYKVLLSESGMTVFDHTGAAVASYGATTTIGKSYGNNVYIDNNSVNIRSGSDVLARFSGDGAVFGKDGDDSVTTTDNTGLYVKYKYTNLEGEDFSVPVIVLKPLFAGDDFTIPIIASEATGDGTTKRYASRYISLDPEAYMDIDNPERRVFAVLLDGVKTEDYTVEVHYYPDTPESSSFYIVFETAPTSGTEIQIVMYAEPADIILYQLTPFYPDASSIFPAAVFAETVAFLDHIRVGKGIYLGEDKVTAKYEANDIVEFAALRVPGIATEAGKVYGSLILDKPIDPRASVAITYTGGYVRGAGVQISGATIAAEIDFDGIAFHGDLGHALTISATKSSAFTQYQTYMIVLTGVTITFS